MSDLHELTDAPAAGLANVLAFRRELALGFQRSAVVGLCMVMAAAAAQILGTLMADGQGAQAKLPFMATSALVITLTAASLAIGRAWGLRLAAIFFCVTVALALFGSAWVLGNGIHSGASHALVALIVIAGFMIGPGAARLFTAACTGLLFLLWWAEGQGWIDGLTPANTPLPATMAMIKIVICLLVGWLVHRYCSLFWSLLHSMECHKEQLAEALQAQRASASELRERESTLRTLLDSSLTGIVILNPQSGERLFVNQPFLDRHGCAAQHLLSDEMLMPDAQHGPAQLMALMQQAAHAGPQRAAWRTQDQAGQSIWWDLRLDKLAYQGQCCVVCFGHDVTDRVAAEQALQAHGQRLVQDVQARTAQLRDEQQRTQAIIESLPITLCLSDTEGRILSVNRRFEVATGISRQWLLGQHLDALRHDPQRACAAELVRSTPQNTPDGAGVPVEHRMMRAGSVTADFLLSCVALPDQQGHPGAVISLGTDITPQKRLEAELRMAKDEAEQLARVKSQFLSNMSHEIRTPLNAILGQAQLGAHDRASAPDSQRRFAGILQSGQFLLSLINDILDSSKLESGKIAVECTPVCLPDLLADALALVEGPARHKGLALSSSVAAEVPAWVGLDRLRVSQVLVNLLSNAVKFTEHGRVGLVVSKLKGADGDWLSFDVSDTGIGIAPEAVGRLFNAFEQADASVTRRFGGSGLGLSISQGLARLMEGEIQVRSQPGQGACFTLKLPLRPAGPAAEPLALPNAAPAAHALAGWRLLITDDVQLNREILQELLESCGAEVVAADSGDAAIRCVTNNPGPRGFSAVIMDIQMPGMDGYEATRRLHALQPALPVLALTAHALDTERQRALDAGMAAHVSKPVNLKELLAALLAHGQAVGPVEAPVRADLVARTVELEIRDGFPVLQGFDLAGALRRCAGKPALLKRLLRLFADELQQYTQQLSSLSTGDGPPLLALLHRLRGGAANLGLVALSQAAARAEAAVKSGQEPGAGSAVQSLRETLHGVKSVLDVWAEADLPETV